jgi:mRNA-degrading endonuclease RelE of RelBE toxin-antitoxin system
MTNINMILHYTERFIRTTKKLPKHIQEDTIRAIDRLQKPEAREPLHVYPLDGRLRGLSAFTVNFAYHVIALANESNIFLLDVAPREK